MKFLFTSLTLVLLSFFDIAKEVQIPLFDPSHEAENVSIPRIAIIGASVGKPDSHI
jgi:hypothetical protein